MKRILVLGMHRSGASALGRAIALLGASVGTGPLTKTYDNIQLRKVNDTLLETGGGAWEAPPTGEDWLEEPAARAIVERAERTLAAELPPETVTVWKDPRTSLTLPFWVDLFDEEPIVVLVHRHPDEVAASLKTSDSVRPAHAYALWEHYNAAALTGAVGLPTIVLDYGQVMSYPIEAATFVSKALSVWGVDLPNDPATTDVELSPQQRHHVAKDRDRIDPATTPSQAAMFTLLDTLAGAHRSLALPAPIAAPSPLSTEILNMAATIRALRRERRELRQSERKAKQQTAKRADEAVGARRTRRAGAETDPATTDAPADALFGAYATGDAAPVVADPTPSPSTPAEPDRA